MSKFHRLGQDKSEEEKSVFSFFKRMMNKISNKKEIPDNAWELEDERASGGGTPRRFKSRD
jgi:hypothetical protein